LRPMAGFKDLHSFQISDVTFPGGCSLQWDDKRFMNDGEYMNETIYTVKLADVDIAQGLVRADGADITFGTTEASRINLLLKIWEKNGGRMKPRGGDRNSQDNSVSIALQERDDISRRIAWALVHAVSLCGGKASR
jgi:hypothetical protein